MTPEGNNPSDLKFALTFVCRASTESGLGHLTRTVQVARLASEHPAIRCRLIVIGDDPVMRLAAESGVDHLFIDEARIDDVPGVVSSYQPDTLVVDALDLPTKIWEGLPAATKRVSISPIFSHQDSMHEVISRAPTHDGIKSEKWETGLEYAVIPDHVEPIPHAEYVEQLFRDPFSIAVSMGGADAPNRTLAVIEALQDAPQNMLIWVMLGEGYSHSYQEIARAAAGDRRHEIIIAKTTRSMWSVLRRCSVAILAGGLTAYEAAYAGLPSICLLGEARHHMLLGPLVSEGISHALTQQDGWEEDLNNMLRIHSSDRDGLLLQHLAARRLVDGRGAQRILHHLLAVRENGHDEVSAWDE